MQTWVKIVEPENFDPSKSYFIARNWTTGTGGSFVDFWSRMLNGKEQWTGKPGIAIRFKGSESLKGDILRNRTKFSGEHFTIVAVEVPSDADKLWRARKPVFKTSKP